MSRRNTLAAKQQRRAQREQHRNREAERARRPDPVVQVGAMWLALTALTDLRWSIR